MSETLLRDYLKNVETYYKLGIATEHTYRPALQKLLLSLISGITVLNEPKRVKCGAPDYAVLRHTPHGNLTVAMSRPRTLAFLWTKRRRASS